MIGIRLTLKEREILKKYDGHNQDFNFVLFAARLKELLEKRTGRKFYLGEDCQFHQSLQRIKNNDG